MSYVKTEKARPRKVDARKGGKVFIQLPPLKMRPKVIPDTKPVRCPLGKNKDDSLQVADFVLVKKDKTNRFVGTIYLENKTPIDMAYRVKGASIVPDRYGPESMIGIVSGLGHEAIKVKTNFKFQDLLFEEIQDDFFDIFAAPAGITKANRAAVAAFWAKGENQHNLERYRVDRILRFEDFDDTVSKVYPSCKVPK